MAAIQQIRNKSGGASESFELTISAEVLLEISYQRTILHQGAYGF